MALCRRVRVVSACSDFIGAAVENATHGWLFSHTGSEQISAGFQQSFFDNGFFNKG
jgi:hypothetical protein